MILSLYPGTIPKRCDPTQLPALKDVLAQSRGVATSKLMEGGLAPHLGHLSVLLVISKVGSPAAHPLAAWPRR